MQYANPTQKAGWLPVLSYLMLIAALYYSAFDRLINNDWRKDDYSYGILIPFIVLYLLWEKKDILMSTPSKPTWFGYFFLIPGVFLFWFGELAGEFFMLYFSCWSIVVALCWINMGFEKIKVMAFPLLFSLTMFPLPNFINVKITLSLKLLSTKIGVAMMQIYGMSAFREGNVIDLGFTKLQVVDACSGLRYLFPMIVLSILIAYYYRAQIWKKIILVLSTIPLTILSNSIRIALTGILSEKFGSNAVEGFFHDFEGLLIFLITLVVLVFEKWILDKLFPKKKNLLKTNNQAPNDSPSIPASGISLKTPQFIVSIILLSATLALSQGIEFREAVPIGKALDRFPMKIARWEGTRHFLDKEFIETLDFSDYIMVDYEDESKKAINFYVAYYASQRKGESIHSPASCLRGGGWQFEEAGGSSMMITEDTRLPFNRAIIEKKPIRQISYYWFPSRDRILTNAYQMKLFNFWDALTQQRTDGALVRVITVVYPDENIGQAEIRMKEFVKDMYPILSEFLPK